MFSVRCSWEFCDGIHSAYKSDNEEHPKYFHLESLHWRSPGYAFLRSFHIDGLHFGGKQNRPVIWCRWTQDLRAIELIQQQADISCLLV